MQRTHTRAPALPILFAVLFLAAVALACVAVGRWEPLAATLAVMLTVLAVEVDERR